ncbi:MAG: nucleotidyltransferase family protein [Ignavibacteria bacterium]
MSTLNEILSLLSLNKESLKNKYNIKTLGIFGSYSRGDFHKNSDIDIIVEFEKSPGYEFIDLADELEIILKKKVDLVSKKAIKPKYLNYIYSEIKYA